MNQKSSFICRFSMIFVLVSFLIGCTDSGQADPAPDTKRDTRHTFLHPEASGTDVQENELASLDISNLSEGYLIAGYHGTAAEARLQITLPESTVCTYSIISEEPAVIPLTGGNGSYHIDILEHVHDDLYALIFSQDIEVSLKDEFVPYLYPNQYVWFTAESDVTAFGISLSDQSSSDLEYLEQVYDYVTQNITYDTELAANIPLNYIPDIDHTFSSQKGICFDYASIMCALLRSQGIPSKLVTGYSGTAYHAWISVYLEETGWIDSIIRFDGEHWSMMDPTLAASNDSKAVEKYIGDGSNYLAKYYY